jgi:hypothetical protein
MVADFRHNERFGEARFELFGERSREVMVIAVWWEQSSGITYPPRVWVRTCVWYVLCILTLLITDVVPFEYLECWAWAWNIYLLCRFIKEFNLLALSYSPSIWCFQRPLRLLLNIRPSCLGIIHFPSLTVTFNLPGVRFFIWEYMHGNKTGQS